MEIVKLNKQDRLSAKDSSKIKNTRSLNRSFGKPNDYVEIHIHDLGGKWLNSIPNYKGYSLPEQIENLNQPKLSNTIFLDPTKILGRLEYTTGQYDVICNIHRKKLFSGLQPDFYIKEISPSKREIKIGSHQYDAIQLEKATLNYIAELEDSVFNKDFVLNFGNNLNILGINIAWNTNGQDILIKLYEPLPEDVELNSDFWIVEEIIEPLEFKVDLGQLNAPDIGIPIKGPNFRIDTRLNDSIPSQFKVYNDFLENTNSSSLYNVLSHLSESANLSINYTKTGTGSLETGYHFENFTHFGSAEERLKNFKYKLELLELFEAQINEINTIQGSISSSVAVTSNINLIEGKKANLISNFDNYEKFLYYENHPYAWPKTPDFGIGTLQITGSTLQPEAYWLQVGLTDCDVFFKPYNLRPTTSSQAVAWYGSTKELNLDYGGQILSASRFDRDNRHSLVRTIPEHISMREENESYLTFTNMIGHYFDQIWLYIDHIGQIKNAHNSFSDGISKDLVFTALSSLGIEAFDQFENEELFEYIIGTSKTKSGSFGTYEAPLGQTMITSSLVTCDNGGSSMPKGDITKEVWKRLYHNLPYLLKTKGTERGIKALMNCYGVPETILNIKEYGGPTTDETTYKTFNYEKASRALAGSSENNGYFIKTPWASNDLAFTEIVESCPSPAEGKIIFSIGAVKDLFNAPFPKTVELTATEGSVHTFDTGFDFMLNHESGLETAQSLTAAIDANPLFTASLFIREDLYHRNHEKYSLDIEIMLTQHLIGTDGNTEIKGSLFEDTWTPACGNPQQFPEVEFLTKTNFKGGGGNTTSTSVTTIIPGTDSCDSKTLIQNGIAFDGSGTLINNGLFQDESEFMEFISTFANGYTDKDISTFMYESITPSATPLYLGASQCKGVNDHGLFVLECFKADPDCAGQIISGGGGGGPTNNGPDAIFTINKMSTGEVGTYPYASAVGHWRWNVLGQNGSNGVGGQLYILPDWIWERDVSITALQLKTYLTTGTTGDNSKDSQLSFFTDPINKIGGIYPLWQLGNQDLTTGAGQWQFNGNSLISPIIDATDPTGTYGNSVLTQQQSNQTYLPTIANSAVSCLVWECDAINPGVVTGPGAPDLTQDPQFLGITSQEVVTFLEVHCGPNSTWNPDPVNAFSDTCFTKYTDFITAANAEGIINTAIPGINVDTVFSELITPDIITIFPASSSCGCDDYTGGSITTNILTDSPITHSPVTLGQGAQEASYGSTGARFFANTTASNFYNVPTTNTYFGSNGSPNNGKLNNIGVWDSTVPYYGNNSITMTPLDQWVGFSECIIVPEEGEYLVGMAGDDRIRFSVDNELLINKDQIDSANYNNWWVYKINLNAGSHVINMEAWNDSGIASLGCEIIGPFPQSTFNTDGDFVNVDAGLKTINGTTYVDLEDLCKNNIIFSSGDAVIGGSTNNCDLKTLVHNEYSLSGLTTGGAFSSIASAMNYITMDPEDPSVINSPSMAHANYWNNTDLSTLKFALMEDWSDSNHSNYDPEACIETRTIDSTAYVVTILSFEYLQGISISLSSYLSFNNPNAATQYSNDPTTYTAGSWETVMQDASVLQAKTNYPQLFVNSNGIAFTPNYRGFNDINAKVQMSINWVNCKCSLVSVGGEFQTQTNECPEGYHWNECNGQCEQIEIITDAGENCEGLVLNPEQGLNGVFNTAAEFVDYWTTFTNGFYGEDIDQFYFESNEPLPWGTYVDSPCTGSNGLPIRRILGFKKDSSLTPLDENIYTNYQTFLQQLNIDDHGVGEADLSTYFSDLFTELIDIPQEGSCDSKTLVINPLSADGTFPNTAPDSGNTGFVDFLEHYSEQSNGLQNLDISSLKFALDPDSLTTTFEGNCPIDASIYCFYDGTSMTSNVVKNVIETVENWAAEQGEDFTGTIYHMVSAHERWLDVARLPFSNIGDHLQNGGWGSINTVFSEFDSVALAQDHRGAKVSNNINIGDKSFAEENRSLIASVIPGTGEEGNYGSYGGTVNLLGISEGVATTVTNTTGEPLGTGLTVNVIYRSTGVFKGARVLTLPSGAVTAPSSGTTAALPTTINGLNPNGTGATVTVTSDGNNITGVTISAIGSGYPPILTNETLTVTKADMDQDGSIGIVGADLVIILSGDEFETELGDVLVKNYGGVKDQYYAIDDMITIASADIGFPTSDLQIKLLSPDIIGKWYRIPFYGTGNSKSKDICDLVSNSGEMILVGGNMVDIKSVVNDGNGMWDDEMPYEYFSRNGNANRFRGPAPSLTGSGEKALCFNFYDESSATNTNAQTQYHQSSPAVAGGFAPTFSGVGLTKTKIEQYQSNHKVGTTNYRSDYELYVKTYLEEIYRKDKTGQIEEYKDQGDLIHLFYPSAPCQGSSPGCYNSGNSNSNRLLGADNTTIFHKTQLAFPLHIWSSILTGSHDGQNPGMLETGHDYLETNPPANNAIFLSALDSNGGVNTNPYCQSDWQNTAGQGTPTDYNSQYGYGGLQNYGFKVTDEAVQENTFTPLEFETAVNGVVADTLCADYSESIWSDPNVCLDDNGNQIYHIDNFFMDPDVDPAITPFIKYTDYVTYGSTTLGYSGLTLADTRLESEIEGPIVVDECYCAPPCPNTVVLNNNTSILLIGTEATGTFTPGESINQANNGPLQASVTSWDPITFTLVIEIASGILEFEGQIIGQTSGAILSAVYPTKEKITGTAITGIFVEGEIITQIGSSGITATVAHISPTVNTDFTIVLEITAGSVFNTGNIIGSTSGAILSEVITTALFQEFIIPQPQGVFTDYNEYMQFISLQSNGYVNTDLNQLQFQLADQSFTTTTETEEETVVEGACEIDADVYVYYDHTSMGTIARETAFNAVNDWVIDMQTNQGFDKNVYHMKAEDEQWLRWGYKTLVGPVGTYSQEPAHSDAAIASTAYTGGTYDVLNDGIPAGPPPGDVLVICYLDEAVPRYVSSIPREGDTNYTCDPSFDDGNTGAASPPAPWDPSADFEQDHTNYITAYNAHQSIGNVACFFYPTPILNENGLPSVGQGYSSTMLGALAAITSGDNNDGLLANPPISQHGAVAAVPGGTIMCPGGQEFNALKTENPYFTSGYGGLDQYGWGLNVSFSPMSSELLFTDLNAFVSDSDICNELITTTTTTETFQQVDIICSGPTSTLLNPYGAYTIQQFYQNELISPGATENQYNVDPTGYLSWGDFLTAKLSEQGNSGLPFYENTSNGPVPLISTNTTYNEVLESVELLGTSGLTGCSDTPTVESSCTAIFNTSQNLPPQTDDYGITGQMLIDYMTIGTTGDVTIDTNWSINQGAPGTMNSANMGTPLTSAFIWNGSQWIASLATTFITPGVNDYLLFGACADGVSEACTRWSADVIIDGVPAGDSLTGQNILNYLNDACELEYNSESVTTVPGTSINNFDLAIYNDTYANSNIVGTPEDQLNYMIGAYCSLSTCTPWDITSEYYVNTTSTNDGGCTGANFGNSTNPYSILSSFTFNNGTIIGGDTGFASVNGSYTSWTTFIDALNTAGSTTTTTYTTTVTPSTFPFTSNTQCSGNTFSGVIGDSSANVSSTWVFWGSAYQYGANPPAGNFSSQIYTHTRRDHIDWIAANHPTTNFDEFYFEDTCNTCPDGNCEVTKRYLTKIQMVHRGLDCSGFNNYNAFEFSYFSLMQDGTSFASDEYISWSGLITALNACSQQNDSVNHFSNTDSLQDVVTMIESLSSTDRHEGCLMEFYLQSNIDLCVCTEIPGSVITQSISTTINDDEFDYNMTTNAVLTLLYGWDGDQGDANDATITVNTIDATCTDVPGPSTELTESCDNIFIPLVGTIDGGACECTSNQSGGDPIPGDIEFESCICCPESSSIEYGCLLAGELSSSRCECTAPTTETVITYGEDSCYQIIPSGSTKFVEFRIKPHRLDKPEYTSLEACCDPITETPNPSHLFSLDAPQGSPTIVLSPHLDGDVSASGDMVSYGKLELYKEGTVVSTTPIFPVYNGDFWNIFIGTSEETLDEYDNQNVYFGAYQSNFLGHITNVTASAVWTQQQRGWSFGDAYHNTNYGSSPATTAYICGNGGTSNGTLNSFKYSGSLQEVKYYTKEYLTHSTLKKHALDPFQYAGNTVSSSWENVFLRLPLGSNNKVDSASYNNNGAGIIQNFNPHPLISQDIYNSESIASSITGQSFSEVYEIHRHLTPDTVGISTTSEKVRIDSGSIDRDILSFDIKAEESTLDRQPLDYNDLGVFFSPQKEINEDIVYTLGGFRMDDYIGDPTHQSLNEYPDLAELKHKYFKKYLNSYRQNFWDYIKLIQYIDHTLFKVIEQWVPAKANLKTGLLIEPHYLERIKFKRNIPVLERLEREAKIEPYLNLEGEVKYYEACINISDKVNENYYQWDGALTASDNLYMSQSKHASDECNPYITMYDNFDPLYGNFLDCDVSKRYYYLPRPPGGDGSIVQTGTPFTPNPVTPIRISGPGLTSGTGQLYGGSGPVTNDGPQMANLGTGASGGGGYA